MPEEWNGQRTARPDALALRVLDLLLQRPVLTTAAVSAHFGVPAEMVRNALEWREADGISPTCWLHWTSPRVASPTMSHNNLPVVVAHSPTDSS